MPKITTFLILLFLPLASYAGESLLTGFHATHKEKEQTSRFNLDFNERPNYNIFTLNDPPRIVIDIKKTKWDKTLQVTSKNNLLKAVRHFQKADDSLRVVLDINNSATLKNNFTIDPTRKNGPYRLVVDVASSPTPAKATEQKKAEFVPIPVLKERPKPLIVIDAGHGGNDPGTIGTHGVQEKDITLQYANELQNQLLATGMYNVYLTRNSDVYIPLNERVKKARQAKGDVFISIHVNSHPSKATEGLSIYTLSENASDKEAAALAQKENKEGIISGVDMESKEFDLAELFIDLAQRDTKNLSASLAESILANVKTEAKLLHNPHRFAGFRVLTGADIPSVLIELGYLSNKKEEKLLTSEKYKNKLAKAIVKAIDNHFSTYQLESKIQIEE
jgi:N-acetylmuramoyl-L-alanine amidase